MRPEINYNVTKLTLSELYVALTNMNKQLQKLDQNDKETILKHNTYKDLIMQEIDRKQII